MKSKSTADISHHHHQLQSDGHHNDDDETLSLRDLPTTAATATTSNHSRPYSDTFFEFITTTAVAATSASDDVILDGHILPYTPPLRPRRSLSLSSAVTRSEPNLSAPVITRSSSAVRPSHRKVRRTGAKSEEKSPLLYSRNSSSSSSSSCNKNNNTEIMKSPWYNWLIYGLPMKIPTEIELKDIKYRQSRRNITPTRFFSGDRRNNTSASWRLLSVLSCKSHSSIDVINTPPIFP